MCDSGEIQTEINQNHVNHNEITKLNNNNTPKSVPNENNITNIEFLHEEDHNVGLIKDSINLSSTIKNGANSHSEDLKLLETKSYKIPKNVISVMENVDLYQESSTKPGVEVVRDGFMEKKSDKSMKDGNNMKNEIGSDEQLESANNEDPNKNLRPVQDVENERNKDVTSKLILDENLETKLSDKLLDLHSTENNMAPSVNGNSRKNSGIGLEDENSIKYSNFPKKINTKLIDNNQLQHRSDKADIKFVKDIPNVEVADVSNINIKDYGDITQNTYESNSNRNTEVKIDSTSSVSSGKNIDVPQNTKVSNSVENLEPLKSVDITENTSVNLKRNLEPKESGALKREMTDKINKKKTMSVREILKKSMEIRGRRLERITFNQSVDDSTSSVSKLKENADSKEENNVNSNIEEEKGSEKNPDKSVLARNEVLRESVEDNNEYGVKLIEIVEKGGKKVEDKDEIVEKEGKMVGNKDEILVNEGEIVGDKYKIVVKEGKIVKSKDDLMKEGKIVEDRYKIVVKEGSILEDEDEIVEKEGNIVEDEDEIVEKEGNIVEDEDEIPTVNERSKKMRRKLRRRLPLTQRTLDIGEPSSKLDEIVTLESSCDKNLQEIEELKKPSRTRTGKKLTEKIVVNNCESLQQKRITRRRKESVSHILESRTSSMFSEERVDEIEGEKSAYREEDPPVSSQTRSRRLRERTAQQSVDDFVSLLNLDENSVISNDNVAKITNGGKISRKLLPQVVEVVDVAQILENSEATEYGLEEIFGIKKEIFDGEQSAPRETSGRRTSKIRGRRGQRRNVPQRELEENVDVSEGNVDSGEESLKVVKITGKTCRKKVGQKTTPEGSDNIPVFDLEDGVDITENCVEGDLNLRNSSKIGSKKRRVSQGVKNPAKLSSRIGKNSVTHEKLSEFKKNRTELNQSISDEFHSAFIENVVKFPSRSGNSFVEENTNDLPSVVDNLEKSVEDSGEFEKTFVKRKVGRSKSVKKSLEKVNTVLNSMSSTSNSEDLDIFSSNHSESVRDLRQRSTELGSDFVEIDGGLIGKKKKKKKKKSNPELQQDVTGKVKLRVRDDLMMNINKMAVNQNSQPPFTGRYSSNALAGDGLRMLIKKEIDSTQNKNLSPEIYEEDIFIYGNVAHKIRYVIRHEKIKQEEYTPEYETANIEESHNIDEELEEEEEDIKELEENVSNNVPLQVFKEPIEVVNPTTAQPIVREFKFRNNNGKKSHPIAKNVNIDSFVSRCQRTVIDNNSKKNFDGIYNKMNGKYTMTIKTRNSCDAMDDKTVETVGSKKDLVKKVLGRRKSVKRVTRRSAEVPHLLKSGNSSSLVAPHLVKSVDRLNSSSVGVPQREKSVDRLDSSSVGDSHLVNNVSGWDSTSNCKETNSIFEKNACNSGGSNLVKKFENFGRLDLNSVGNVSKNGNVSSNRDLVRSLAQLVSKLDSVAKNNALKNTDIVESNSGRVLVDSGKVVDKNLRVSVSELGYVSSSNFSSSDNTTWDSCNDNTKNSSNSSPSNDFSNGDNSLNLDSIKDITKSSSVSPSDNNVSKRASVLMSSNEDFDQISSDSISNNVISHSVSELDSEFIENYVKNTSNPSSISEVSCISNSNQDVVNTSSNIVSNGTSISDSDKELGKSISDSISNNNDNVLNSCSTSDSNNGDADFSSNTDFSKRVSISDSNEDLAKNSNNIAERLSKSATKSKKSAVKTVRKSPRKRKLSSNDNSSVEDVSNNKVSPDLSSDVGNNFSTISNSNNDPSPENNTKNVVNVVSSSKSISKKEVKSVGKLKAGFKNEIGDFKNVTNGRSESVSNNNNNNNNLSNNIINSSASESNTHDHIEIKLEPIGDGDTVLDNDQLCVDTVSNNDRLVVDTLLNSELDVVEEKYSSVLEGTSLNRLDDSTFLEGTSLNQLDDDADNEFMNTVRSLMEDEIGKNRGDEEIKVRKRRRPKCDLPPIPSSLKCHICERVMKNRQSYECHMKKHTDPSKQWMKCSCCKKLLAGERRLKNHMLNFHTFTNTYVCDICSKIFHVRGNLYKHIVSVHLSLNTYTCDICKKSFKKKTYLRDHIGMHMGMKKHACGFCGKNFWNRTDLQNHIDGHVGFDRYTCGVCSKRMTSLATLNIHMKLHTHENMHKCEYCGKEYPTKNSLQRHINLHTGRKFTCSTCGAQFHYRNCYNRHVKTHEGKQQECHVCHKVFQRKCYLKKHMTIHLGTERFMCVYCGKKFIDKSDYNKHVNTHTHAQKFPCEFCGKVFHVKAYLVSHRKMHTGDMEHVCKYCGKKFMKRGLLDRHVSIHEGRNFVACDICGKVLSSEASCKRHVWNKHGINRYCS